MSEAAVNLWRENRVFDARRPRPALFGFAGAVVAVIAWAGQGLAQDQVRNYAGKPILVVETEGHHAPVRKLVWRDENTLLAGGDDKVVKEWRLGDGGRLARSYRPPIWRGPAGMILALALSPRADQAGQRLLAVGGYGVESRRGDFTVFRTPGTSPEPTGDVAARLLPPRQPGQIGHLGPVAVLAFNPAGTILASGSTDQTVILWDVATWRPLRVLRGHTGAIRALEFNPDGARLASAGTDGSLRIWDVAQGVQVDARLGDAQRPDPINALAYSPDGQSILVGLEGGALYRFAAGGLAAAPVRLPTDAQAGPVEAVVFEPGGRRLAVSIKSDRAPTLDPVALACDVQVRAMPAGAVAWQRRVPGLVRAIAFSPAGARLAYSGGHDQAIVVHDSRALDQPPLVLKGDGGTPFDLGFTADGDTIGFTRIRREPVNPPAPAEGFDLRKRAWRPVDRALLRPAIKQYAGWTLEGDVNAYRLEAVNADGRRVPIVLDRATEQLWWSWTFIPPGPRHPRATVAIGTVAGVSIFDLETGARTRVFAGPLAAVVSVAPSPDGRWLACGSLDQTVTLYPLADCDRRPGLGARFRAGPEGLVVESVEPRSFADAMGLIPGDEITLAYVGGRGFARRGDLERLKLKDEITAFPAAADQAPAGLLTLGIESRRRIPVPFLGVLDYRARMPSTKRDSPALTLLLGEDKEWVLWTPSGYYDTSIEGDSRLLGWQTNPPYDAARPTDYVPIAAHAGAMNQPAVLERLWATGDVVQALGAIPPAQIPERIAEQDQPPRITLAAGPGVAPPPNPGDVWAVAVARPRVVFTLSSDGKSPIRERKIVLGEKRVVQPALAAPTGELSETVDLDLQPNQRTRLLIEAVNTGGGRRTLTHDLVYTPPQPPPAPPAPPPPRLFLVSIGADTYVNSLITPVKFADQDAERLAAFVAAHLVSAEAGRLACDGPRILTGSRASARSIEQELDRLHQILQEKKLRPGDVVALVIAGHLLAAREGARLAAHDTDPGDPPRPAALARDLAALLGEFTDYGCRAVVFLDAVHPLGESLSSSIKPFVRELQQKRGVITFVASKEGPGGADETARLGLFALGLTGVFQSANLAGQTGDRKAVYTLDQFKTALRTRVLMLSERHQEAACYIPLEVFERTPFAAP